MKRILASAFCCLMLSTLCGCYRQTTIILPQGQTLPTAATQSPETTIPETASLSTQEPEATSAPPKASETAKPKQPQASHETTAPAESTPPVENTESAEAAASAETAPPTETTKPEETNAPMETTPPAQSLEHPVYDISTHHIGSYEKSILGEMNRYRVDSGISPLTMSKKLSALAAIRAYECSKAFSHTRPDGRGWDTVLSDYGASAYTESILYASSGTGADLLLDACMSSGNHSQKIMNSDYRTAGIGIFDTGRYIYITIIFS